MIAEGLDKGITALAKDLPRLLDTGLISREGGNGTPQDASVLVEINHRFNLAQGSNDVGTANGKANAKPTHVVGLRQAIEFNAHLAIAIHFKDRGCPLRIKDEINVGKIMHQ